MAAPLERAPAWDVDVTDGDALARAAAQVRSHFGRADVLVVNAGIGAGGPLLAMDATSYDRVIEVNLLGSVRTVRAFLPALVESRGYVLQVASLAAMVRVGVAYLAFTDTAMVAAADVEPRMAAFRGALPGPFGRPRPLPPAVTRVVHGIERRSSTVHAQGRLRAVPLLRAAAPFVITRTQGRRSGKAEAELARSLSGTSG